MESLSHTFSMKALLILLKNMRRMTVAEIAAEMGEPHGSVVHAIDAVRDAGLVEAYARRGAPYEEEVYLTPQGRSVAEKLSEIESIIGWGGRDEIT
ncbi:MAG: MarR family transcriptional regulator [Candidatus Bathyarchaeia archaeon]